MKNIIKLFLLMSVGVHSLSIRAEVGTENPESHAPRRPEADVPEAIREAQSENNVGGKAPLSSQAAKGEDMELRNWVTKRIWATTLGRMFSDYLFGTATPEDNIRKVHRLVDRLFENVYLSMSRTSAIQLMMEDIFVTGRLDPIVNDRIGLLNLNMALKRHALEVQAAHELNWQLPAIGAIGVLAGSELIRGTAGTIARAAKTNARWFILRSGYDEARVARRALRAINPRDLLRVEKVFDGATYSNTKAAGTALAAFLAYTPIYFQARAGSADSASPTMKVVIYGVEQLLDLSVL